MARRSRAGAAGTAVLIVALAVGWLFLGPSRLGGSTTYVRTSGHSMQPRFHTGDLALVRPATSYAAGDIVAYRSSDLKAVVLHRIIADNHGVYSFKGDNNNFVDPDHPIRAQFIGRLWLRIPHGGDALTWLHGPVHVALLVFAVGLLAGSGDQLRRKAKGAAGRPLPAAVRRQLVRAGFGTAALTLACVVAAAVATSVPGFAAGTASVPYSQVIDFSYDATAGRSAVYPDGLVTTGDPLFLRQIRLVTVHARFRFRSAAAHAITGRIGIDTRLSAPSGWSQTLGSSQSIAFTGDTADVSVRLDLAELLARGGRIDAQTGVPDATFTVAVRPHVSLEGTLGTGALSDTDDAPLTMSLTALQAKVVGSDGGPATSAALTNTKTGVAHLPAQVPRRVGFAGHTVDVATVRLAALAGLALGMIALLVEGLALAVADHPVRPRAGGRARHAARRPEHHPARLGAGHSARRAARRTTRQARVASPVRPRPPADCFLLPPLTGKTARVWPSRPAGP